MNTLLKESKSFVGGTVRIIMILLIPETSKSFVCRAHVQQHLLLYKL